MNTLYPLLLVILAVFLQPIWEDCWNVLRRRWLRPLGRRFARAWNAFLDDPY